MRTAVYAGDRCEATIDTGRAVLVIDAGPTPAGEPADLENGRPALDLTPAVWTPHVLAPNACRVTDHLAL
jgi:hypothetical protein